MKLFGVQIRIIYIEETETGAPSIRFRSDLGKEDSMNGFLFTPMTRFNAEALDYMKNAGRADGQTAGTESEGTGSFADTVQDKIIRKEQQAAEMVFRAGNSGGKRTDCTKKKRQKSFWEKRAERHKLYMDLATKAWYKRENERKYQENIDLARKEVSSAILRQQAMERATGEKVELGVNPDVLSEAATELAQNYIFFKIPSALVNPKAKGGAAR